MFTVVWGWNMLNVSRLLKSGGLRPKLLAAVFAGVCAIGLFYYFNRFVQYQAPSFLTFSELKQLSKNPRPNFFLKRKLEQFWRAPLISNQAYYAGVKPYRP